MMLKADKAINEKGEPEDSQVPASVCCDADSQLVAQALAQVESDACGVLGGISAVFSGKALFKNAW